MKESRKQLIKDLHSKVGIVWQTSIEKEFPKLFKKEVNGWYKDKKVKGWCVFIKNGIIKYGFIRNVTWFENHNCNYKLRKNDYKATNKEVARALIKEAKNRGFKKGVRFTCLCNKVIVNDCWTMFCSEGYLWIDGGCVFKDGKWATPIETITKKQAKKVTEAVFLKMVSGQHQ